MSEIQVIIGYASCSIAAGANKVYDTFLSFKEKQNINYVLKKTGCNGMCFNEPIVEIIDSDTKFHYYLVNEEKATEIFKNHILKNRNESFDNSIISENTKESDFLAGQLKIATRNCGIIDPENIEEYISTGGYSAIANILANDISPDKIIKEIIDSGLRGRGGGGFSTGQKWLYGYQSKSDEKYFICNADEGDPGAFMDRSLLESDPHSIIEGMMIGAYCIGAQDAYIYCRAEYPLAIKRLNIAIEQAKEKGFIGKNIFNKKTHNFNLYIKEGAGAFVCGEETALIASIEGERGMPRKRPPFPTESGLNNKPTVINNVETLANVAWIVKNGSSNFAKYGTEKSKGTKVFALAGKINRGGLVEVPMGVSINDVIFKLGGGIQNSNQLKAVQLGGPSGGCIPADLCDTIIDYESVNATGAIMGSGGMVVLDNSCCMVDIAKFFIDFTQKESCGKCTFCRIGTKRLQEILNNITNGEGKEEDIEKIENLSLLIKNNSLCGLGQTAPNPIITTLKYFKSEYENHILNKKCNAKICKPLLTYTIIDEKCTGCTVCSKICPSKCITGNKKETHFIEQSLCIKCGMCYTKCKFEAILID